MKDIVAIGEVLIDLTQKGVDELGEGRWLAARREEGGLRPPPRRPRLPAAGSPAL